MPQTATAGCRAIANVSEMCEMSPLGADSGNRESMPPQYFVFPVCHSHPRPGLVPGRSPNSRQSVDDSRVFPQSGVALSGRPDMGRRSDVFGDGVSL